MTEKLPSADDATHRDGSRLSEGLGPLVVSPCLACPTPGLCTNVDRCVTPKPGETWHILRNGATVCVTLTIAEITQRTVLFEPTLFSAYGDRVPLGMGLRFIERVCGPNVRANRDRCGAAE